MHIDLNKAMLRKGRPRRMLSVSANISTKIQLLLDIALVEAMLFISLQVQGIHNVGVYHYPGILAALFMWLVYSNSGVYRRHSSEISRMMSIFFAWLKVGAILIIIAYLFKVSEDYSRVVIVTWLVASAPLQVIAHLVVNFLVGLQKKGQAIPSLLVGNSQLGSYLSKNINKNPWTAHEIIGVISDDDDDESWLAKDLPKLGDLDDLHAAVMKHDIKRVYFAMSLKSSHMVREMQLGLVDLNVDIVWAPDIFSFHMVSPSVKEVAGIPLYYLSESPLVEGAWVSKIILDKVVASIALLLLSPLMIMAALAVKLSSPGPVFYGQERHGLDGKIFKVLKFRSMLVHEEVQGQVSQATKGDSRITKVGNFLRKSSIDELPQIFNVLRGDMSLVGPRPHAKTHNHFYTEKINAYMSRHRVLPGMTGLAQVNGCRGETDAIEKMEKRVEYDLAYINSWSIWLDVRIMIKTVYTLFSKNAY